MPVPANKSCISQREPREKFLAVVRRGAAADEINLLLSELRREQRLRRDAARVAELAVHIARGERRIADAEDVAVLLNLTRQVLEACV